MNVTAWNDTADEQFPSLPALQAPKLKKEGQDTKPIADPNGGAGTDITHRLSIVVHSLEMAGRVERKNPQ